MYHSHAVPEACRGGSDGAYCAGLVQGLLCFAAAWWWTQKKNADPSGSARWVFASAPAAEDHLPIPDEEVEAAARRILSEKGIRSAPTEHQLEEATDVPAAPQAGLGSRRAAGGRAYHAASER